MAETEAADEDAAPKKKSKLPLILGLLLCVSGAGSGFYAVYSGLIFGDAQTDQSAATTPQVSPLPDIAFVPIDPLVVNLGNDASARHLRFRAQVEVEGKHAKEVESVLPRIADVLNSYLRAVDIHMIEDRSALVRLRAQMLRRIKLVAGADRVRDLLIMEFVMN